MANFQVIFKQSLFGKEMLNIMNWQLASNGATYLQDFADAIKDSFEVACDDHLSVEWALNSLSLRQMDGGGPFSIEQTFTTGVLNGLNANEVLPTTNAMLVSTIYSGSRPNRGRIYFPALCENNCEDSAWGSGTLADFVTMVQLWGDGLTVSGGSAFLRIARLALSTNTWSLDSPVELAIGRIRPATIRNRRLQ